MDRLDDIKYRLKTAREFWDNMNHGKSEPLPYAREMVDSEWLVAMLDEAVKTTEEFLGTGWLDIWATRVEEPK